MNKFIIRPIHYTLLLLPLFISCSKDFLNNTPKGFQLANTPADYKNMLEDQILSSMADYNSGSGSFFPTPGPGLLGDDIAVLYPVFSNWSGLYGSLKAVTALFSWSADIWTDQDNSHELLAEYNKIYFSNKIINEVLTSSGGSEQQKKQYYAEGLANRAFNYFYLLNLFCKPYNEATAASDAGLPLVTRADAVQTGFHRSTLSEAYDFVLNDLTRAIPDLPLEQTTANRFTKAAGEMLLGKVYLWMGRNEEAVKALDAALKDLPFKFSVAGSPKLIDYNTASQNPFPISAYVFTTPDVVGYGQKPPYPESLVSREAFSLMIGGHLASGIMVTPETLSLFKSNDKRLALYSSNWGVIDGQPGSIPFGLKRINAGNQGYSVGLQLPDLYLLHAEAKARAGDIGTAVTSLVTLRKNRMPAVDAADVPAGRDDLIRFIIDERKREFCGLGIYRWQDMRRLYHDLLFAGTVYKHYTYNQQTGMGDTYILKEERLVLRFPQSVVQQNPGFEQNQ